MSNFRVSECPFCGADVEEMRTADHLKVCREFHEQWGPEGSESTELPSIGSM